MFLTRWKQERARTLLLLLPLTSLLLAIWACGLSIGPHIGYHPPPATHLPASQLRLEIGITGQYDQYGSTPNALMQVRVFEEATSREVSLPDTASLTCNGANIKPYTGNALPHVCPRQPPEGTYRIVYTDDHGASTTVVVPVPGSSFAIVSPQDGSTVKIPTNGVLPVRYTIPSVPPNGSVAINDVTAACSVSPAQPCGAVSANLKPALTPTPGSHAVVTPGTSGSSAVMRVASRAFATTTPGKTPTSGPTPTQGPTPVPAATPKPTLPVPTPTVGVTLSGNAGTILLAGDYSMFQPAKGFLTMDVEAHVTPDPGDFHSVTVSYSDILHVAFTWTR